MFNLKDKKAQLTPSEEPRILDADFKIEEGGYIEHYGETLEVEKIDVNVEAFGMTFTKTLDSVSFANIQAETSPQAKIYIDVSGSDYNKKTLTNRDMVGVRPADQNAIDEFQKTKYGDLEETEEFPTVP